jgi:hypothetical protein
MIPTTGHVARMVQKKNVKSILVGKNDMERNLEEPVFIVNSSVTSHNIDCLENTRAISHVCPAQARK